jgi:hypothetical protein
MLLKGDEGGAKFGRGVAENGDFRQGESGCSLPCAEWRVGEVPFTGNAKITQ